MTDKRRTVIRDIIGNSNESDDDKSDRENEERMIGGGVTLPLPLTPTHSLLYTLNTLFITYRPLIVFTTSQNIQHNIVPNSVINNINAVSILYLITINPT